ncbi:MAG: phytanoyl-CoA dioxygenase family protein [Chthoniobacterales bacterium]
MNTSLISKYKSCPAQLTAAQIEEYHENGFLAFTDVLNEQEVQKACAALTELITLGVYHPDYLQHTLTDLYVQFERGYTPDLSAPMDELELKVRKLMNYARFNAHMNFLATIQKRIQGITSSLLGPNPKLMMSMAMIKPPFIAGEKPWHQDTAYFSITPINSVMGVWIALDPATVKNGCMHVLKGRHKDGPKKHHHTFDCEMLPDRYDASESTPVELPVGGAMFFHGLLPHQTPPNSSSDRRRALQFHYHAANSKSVEREEYDRIFVEADGTPASCEAAR